MKKYFYIVYLLISLVIGEKAKAQIEGTNLVFPPAQNGGPAVTDGGGTLNFGCNGLNNRSYGGGFPDNVITSISDTSGNLLFYINTGLILDTNHVTITVFASDTFAFQNVIIVPFPGHQKEYYIFFDNGVRHSNFYRVFNKQTKTLSKRDSFAPTKIYCGATKHQNKKDYWLIFSGHDSLYSYLLDSNGFNVHAVVSTLKEEQFAHHVFNSTGGKLYTSTLFYSKTSGGICLKSNDFDNATGRFTNEAWLFIDSTQNQIDFPIGISPDEEKIYMLYSTCFNCLPELMQYDISSKDSSQIKRTKTEIAHAIGYGQFTQGPDMKLYLANQEGKTASAFFSVINNPGRDGNGCDFQIGKMKLGPRFAPEFLTRLGYWPSFAIDTDALNPFIIKLFYNAPQPGETYKWDLGDPASGKFNTGTSANISHIYPLGSYMVRLVVTSKDGYSEVFKRKICLGSPFLQTVHDTSVCGPVTLDAGNPWASHLWSTGDTTEKATLQKPGLYWVKLKINNQEITYNFKVKYDGFKTNGFLPEQATVCDGVPYILNPDSLHGIVKWQDSFISKTFTIRQPGIYHATLQNSCGLYKDNIKVSFQECPEPVITIFPNPFDNAFQIQVELVKAAQVQISVYDAIGRLIANIANAHQSIGFQTYPIDGNAYQLSSGIYFVRVLIDGKAYMKKVVKE